LPGFSIIEPAFDHKRPPSNASQRDALSVAPDGASIVLVLEGRFVFGIAQSLFVAKSLHNTSRRDVLNGYRTHGATDKMSLPGHVFYK